MHGRFVDIEDVANFGSDAFDSGRGLFRCHKPCVHSCGDKQRDLRQHHNSIGRPTYLRAFTVLSSYDATKEKTKYELVDGAGKGVLPRQIITRRCSGASYVPQFLWCRFAPFTTKIAPLHRPTDLGVKCQRASEKQWKYLITHGSWALLVGYLVG